MLRNDGRCIYDSKCRIAMAKGAFNRKKTLFTSTLDRNLRKKLVKCYITITNYIWCRNLDASSSRSKTPGKF
jgi:hypothetical protein